MTEEQRRLLKMALNLGWKALEEVNDAVDWCENKRDDYYKMVENVRSALCRSMGTDSLDICDF